MSVRERAQQLYGDLWGRWSRNHDDWDDNMLPIIEAALTAYGNEIRKEAHNHERQNMPVRDGTTSRSGEVLQPTLSEEVIHGQEGVPVSRQAATDGRIGQGPPFGDDQDVVP